MTRVAIFLIIFLGFSLVTFVILSSWHIPAPTVAINKVIPNAELSK